ncbi:RNA recognition motif domain [Dillenia turbinata]|uniref:RNA recognition motif domain n=1 Tax=Dillenia turbinata TaxID=194707 RepID=A0AAN8W9S1_9MAGN
MASLRRISGSISSGRLCSRVSSNGILSVSPASSQTLIPPRLLIPSRGIASKLFVGDSSADLFLLTLDMDALFTLRVFVMLNERDAEDAYCMKRMPNRIPSVLIKLVGDGLSYYTTEQTLSEAFSQYGQVLEATVVVDRVSDRSKGFGFITFASEDAAYKALTEMNGKAILETYALNGRTIFVDYAKPKTVSGGMPIARGPPEPLEQRPIIGGNITKWDKTDLIISKDAAVLSYGVALAVDPPLNI